MAPGPSLEDAGVLDASPGDGATSRDSAAETGVPPVADSAVPPGDGAVVEEGGSPFHVDLHQTSASGLSAGGFMAVQFHVAFSSIMKGAAVFAGGPFFCAGGTLTGAEVGCQYDTVAPSIVPFVAATNKYASAGTIDPISHLAGQRVFLFGGAEDSTVNPVTMDALQQYYATFLSPTDIRYENRHPNTGHTMPTLNYGGACATTGAPYLGNCNYDGAGIALAQIYGTLAPRIATPTGAFVSLLQADFVQSPGSHSLGDTGYAFVPASCSRGETCKIHVAFHGCLQQSSGASGDAFYKHAGYNEWADSNHLIVLYPQTSVGKGAETNPNACWDWWGYDSPDYANQLGPQMAMVRAMIRHFAGQ